MTVKPNLPRSFAGILAVVSSQAVSQRAPATVAKSQKSPAFGGFPTFGDRKSETEFRLLIEVRSNGSIEARARSLRRRNIGLRATRLEVSARCRSRLQNPDSRHLTERVTRGCLRRSRRAARSGRGSPPLHLTVHRGGLARM